MEAVVLGHGRSTPATDMKVERTGITEEITTDNIAMVLVTNGEKSRGAGERDRQALGDTAGSVVVDQKAIHRNPQARGVAAMIGRVE